VSQIYDLGYKRYAGTRKGRGTRWTVIARNQVSLAWKGWIRWKLAFALALITTIVVGAILIILGSGTFRVLEAVSGRGITIADGIIPFTIGEFYTKCGFIIALTLGTLAIATDIQGGAMVFYFARSVRPRDYALGKLAGYGLVVASIMLGGPLVLAALRIGLAASSGDIVNQLVILPKVLAVGVAGTLVYTAVPLAFSAIAANKRYAVGTFAAYYLIIGGIASVLGAVSKSPLAIIDFGNAIESFTFHLFDVQPFGRAPLLDMWAAVTSIAVFTIASIVLIFFRLREEGSAGVGGAA
jgi:hypothetical protein